jgi:uncharacterized protein YpmS
MHPPMTWKTTRTVLLSLLTLATLTTFIRVLSAPAPAKFLETPARSPYDF